jgi:hypothetical protein
LQNLGVFVGETKIGTKMIIKKLFQSEQEFLNYAWSWIGPDHQKIWRDEDVPLLEPFFAATKNGNHNVEWTDEIKASFDHYEKCKLEYADDRIDKRDACQNIDIDYLLDFFFLEEIDAEIDLDISNLKIAEEHKTKMSFPMIFVGFIDSTFDRSGSSGYCLSDYVCLSEFSSEKTQLPSLGANHAL